MVQALVDQGVLSLAGAAALLRQGGPDRARLEGDIKRAVLAAAPRNRDQPLDLATALIATRGAVGEAARRMATARNEALAARLADLGDGTPAGDMIQDLVDRGDLPGAVAAGLLRPDSADHAQLKADIKKAVLAAARQNGDRPLRRSTALIATRGAVELKAADVLLRRGSDGALSVRPLMIARASLADIGIG
jgi:hypothetical protein